MELCRVVKWIVYFCSIQESYNVIYTKHEALTKPYPYTVIKGGSSCVVVIQLIIGHPLL